MPRLFVLISCVCVAFTSSCTNAKTMVKRPSDLNLDVSRLYVPFEAENEQNRSWQRAMREEVSDILTKTQGEKEVTKRIELIGEQFLGRPYGIANDPHEKFVCTTFVESVLAMAMATSSKYESYLSNLRQIYYPDDRIGMVYYNHFPDRDWIPNLIAKKIATDITKDVLAGELTAPMVATAKVDRLSWYKKTHTDFVESFVENFPSEQPSDVSIPYVPLTALNDEVLKRIPHGAIVHVVRPNWQLAEAIGSNLNISHVGFAVWKNGELMFMHASAGTMKVTIENFEAYLKKFLQSPTIKGFNVLQLSL